MNHIVRGILAVVAGLVVGGSVNMGLVVGGSRLIPAPEGVDVSDAQSIADSIHLFEPRHFVFPFLAHALGTLAGATVASLIAAAARHWYAYGIGVLYLIGGIAAACMIPAPIWFVALDLIVAYLPMGWLGLRLACWIRPVA